MINDILKSISKKMLDRKYEESEKLFKNKDFKRALKIYEKLKDTEYYSKIKDNYDRCLVLVKHDNVDNYIKNGDEIFDNIVKGDIDNHNTLNNLENCLIYYNTAVELAELQRDYSLKNTVLLKINHAVGKVMDIELSSVNERFKNAVKDNDINEINKLLKKLRNLEKLLDENGILDIADNELNKCIGELIYKKYILEKTLIDIDIGKYIDEIKSICEKSNNNYDILISDKLRNKILNLKRKYIHNNTYNKYIDKDIIKKDIDELIKKLNKKEFEVLYNNFMKFGYFDYYLKFKNILNRNNQLREHYLKSLINTKNFGLIFKVMNEAYWKKDYPISYYLSSLVLDFMEGGIYWKNELNNEVVASDGNENIVVFGDKVGYIYCINPCSKEYLWNFKLNEEISIIKIINDKVFVGCKYGYLYVFDLKVGNLIDSFEGEDTIIGVEGIGDLIYIGCKNRWVYALDNSLNVIFKKRFNKSLAGIGIVGSHLIVAEYFGKIYCLEGSKILRELYKKDIRGIDVKNDKILLKTSSEVYLLNNKGNVVKKIYDFKSNNYNKQIKNLKLEIHCGNYGVYIVEKIFGKYNIETIYYYDFNKKTLEKLNLKGIKYIQCAKIIGNLFFIGCKYGYVSVIKRDKLIWNYKFDEDITNIVKIKDTLDYENRTKIGISSGNEVYYLNLSTIKDTYMKNIHSPYKYMAGSYYKDKDIKRIEGDIGKIKYAKGLYHLGHYDNARTYLEKIDTKNLENNLKYLRNNYLVLSAVEISKKVPNVLKDKNVVNALKEIKYLNNVRFRYLRSKIYSNNSIDNVSIDFDLDKSDTMSKPDLYKIVDEGKKHFKDGNYKMALNYFKHICKIWKEGIADKSLLSTAVYGTISSCMKLGKYHYEREEYQIAKEYYEKVLEYILKYKIRIDNDKFKLLKNRIKECENADKFKLGTFAKEDRLIKKININECKLYVDNGNGEKGNPINIKDKLGSGGEGAVYIADNGMACKIFNEITENRINKLKLMVGKLNYDGICSPKQLVYDENGTVVGYLMDRAEGKPLKSLLTGPKVLKNNFPNWKKIHIVRLCLTILDKIKYLHSKNVILGDINPQNILVKDEKTVYFIDTDSYQVENYPCPVGTDAFTPPELLRKNFKSILRTFENEYFTVSVLMFMILMYGRHPYSKVGGGNLVENIMKGEFPYSANDKDKVPPGLWGIIWTHLPYDIKNLFIKSFVEGHKDLNKRPNIDEWIKCMRNYYDSLNYNIAYWDKEANEISPRDKKPNTFKYQIIASSYKEKTWEYFRDKGKKIWMWSLFDLDNKGIYIVVSFKPVNFRKMDNKKLFEWAKSQKPMKEYKHRWKTDKYFVKIVKYNR